MILSNIEKAHGVDTFGSVDNRGKDVSSLQLVNKDSGVSSDLNSAESVRLRSDQASFNNRQSVNSKLNSIAKSIRTADNAMDKIASHISNIKAQLTKLVKHYPPFLAGSDERVDMKRGFDAFKSLVDKLTFPPKEDDVTARIMSAPNVNPETGIFEATIDDDGLVIKISGVLPNSFDIPALPEKATDEEIDAIIEKLNIAENSLNNGRASLFSDAVTISGLINESSIIEKINPTFGEELKDNDIDEITADLKSAEIREDLKVESASFTDADAQIMQLLR